MKNLFNIKNLFSKEDVAILEPEIDSDEIVKQIHNEVDSLESKFEEEYKQVLNELEIPTETEVSRKAEKLAKLGISNSNIVMKQSEQIKQSIITATEKQTSYKRALDIQNSYRATYPLDKIVSLEDFNKVINKYKLVYSTIDNYIKDIPEKNVDEMLNAKPVSMYHTIENSYFLTNLKFTFSSYATNKTIEAGKLAVEYLNKIGGIVKIKDEFTSSIIKSFPQIDQQNLQTAICNYADKTIYKQDNNKLFIAAPKSHFNLENVMFDGKQLIIKPQIEKSTWEIKDPIAFYMLKSDFVRIVSKWGTSDDQSYLDPIVVDERMN